MKEFLVRLKRLPFCFVYPIIFSTVFVLLVYGLSCLPGDSFTALKDSAMQYMPLLFVLCASGFLTFYRTDSAKKALAAVFLLLTADTVFFALTETHVALLPALAFAIGLAELLHKTDLLYGYFAGLLLSVTVALALGSLHQFIWNAVVHFAYLLQGRGVVFGMLHPLFSLLFSGSFEALFYHADVGGTVLVNQQLVSGAADIFFADTSAPKRVVALFLSGQFFVNVFVTLGLALCLLPRLRDGERIAFSMACLTAFFCGDYRLEAVFLLVWNPFAFVAYLFLNGVAYLSAAMLDIRIGFTQNASLGQLLRYGNHWWLFLLLGAVLFALTYSLLRLVLLRFPVANPLRYPAQVKQLLRALGGVDNIERLQDERVYVKNPQVINILRVNCDIRENEVTLCQEDLLLLKRYME